MIKNLKKLRTDFGVSQQKLADAIGTSQQSINKYENHGVEPDISTLISIAEYFNVTVDYLIGHCEEIEQNTITVKLTSDEVVFLKGYRELSPKEKICIDTIIKNFNSVL